MYNVLKINWYIWIFIEKINIVIDNIWKYDLISLILKLGFSKEFDRLWIVFKGFLGFF